MIQFDNVENNNCVNEAVRDRETPGKEDLKNPGSRKLGYIIAGIALIGFFLCIFCFLMQKAQEDRIVIAGKSGTEQEILINMYRIMIEEHTNLNVELMPDFGNSSLLFEALKDGEIDLYPESTSTVLFALLKQPAEGTVDPTRLYEAARNLILAQDRIIYLEPTEYRNTYALAIRREFSEKFHIYKISDLAKVQNSVKAGFSSQFNNQWDGNEGLKQVYGLQLEVEIMEPTLRYEALERREIQIVEIHSTDSALKQYDLVLLQDDKRLFPIDQVAPLLREDTLHQYPQLREALENLSGKITSEEMSEMNYAVDAGGRTPKDIAYDYLKVNGLID